MCEINSRLQACFDVGITQSWPFWLETVLSWSACTVVMGQVIFLYFMLYDCMKSRFHFRKVFHNCNEQWGIQCQGLFNEYLGSKIRRLSVSMIVYVLITDFFLRRKSGGLWCLWILISMSTLKPWTEIRSRNAVSIWKQGNYTFSIYLGG